MGNPLYTKTLKPLHKDESVQEILIKNLKSTFAKTGNIPIHKLAC